VNSFDKREMPQGNKKVGNQSKNTQKAAPKIKKGARAIAPKKKGALHGQIKVGKGRKIS